MLTTPEILAILEENSIPEPNSGCWLWEGVGPEYPRIWLKDQKVQVYAHRLACEVSSGGPVKNYACHKCNVSLCVNPDHLYDGTPSQNTIDKYRSGTRSWFQKGHRTWNKGLKFT